MNRVRVVEAILRRWDPIGVEPGEMAPLDEYDGYAPSIVVLVDRGGSLEELSAHLHALRTEVIGVRDDPGRDEEIAKEILAALREGAD